MGLNEVIRSLPMDVQKDLASVDEISISLDP
jgi:hypothetical protein